MVEGGVFAVQPELKSITAIYVSLLAMSCKLSLRIANELEVGVGGEGEREGREGGGGKGGGRGGRVGVGGEGGSVGMGGEGGLGWEVRGGGRDDN